MTAAPSPADRLHPAVPATAAMPAGRLIAAVADPSGRVWEVVLHETEQQYTVRTPPGFSGEDDTGGLMYRTDYETVGHLTHDFGICVPWFVLKAVKDGRTSKGWEPGTHLYSTIGNVTWALPVHVLVEKIVNEDEFLKMDGATSKKVAITDKPWWQRAADKIGAVVKRRPVKTQCPICEREIEMKSDGTIPYHDSPPNGRALCQASLLTIEAAKKLKDQGE